VRGGSFDSSNCITLVARCLNREDATPVIFDQPCRRRRGIRSRHAHEPIQPDRASPLRSSRPSSHHAPTRVFSLRGVPLREADIHGLAGRLVKRALWRVNAFLPAFLARRCSWVFCAPRRFIPADGCRAVSGVPGPRVVLLAARPPRLVFVGVTSRLVESTLEKAVGRGLCSVRDDRLLGFTPVCDPHPTAPRCQNTVCHGIDPASGFASCRVGGRLTAHRNRARPRIRSSASGNTPIAFTRPARPYPLMGFRLLAPIANRRGCRPFSVLMGLTPG
jgi:hypothetical protein